MPAAFHPPALEPFFLTCSLVVTGLIAVTAWWRRTRLKQGHVLLIYLLLTFSLSLAVVALTDLNNLSLLGKGSDAATGRLLAGLLSFTLISWIAVRHSQTYPRACVWWFVIAAVYNCLPGSMPEQIEPHYQDIINAIRLLSAAAAFLLISRYKQNLNAHQYLSILAALVMFAWLSTPLAEENLVPALPAAILTILAGVLFHQERSSAPVSAYIGLDLLLLLGLCSGITPLLEKLLGSNHPLAMLIISLLYLTAAVRVWQRRQQIPRGLLWGTLFSLVVLAGLELLPESSPIDPFPVLLGTLVLLITVLYHAAGTPEPSSWRSRLAAAGACCAFLGIACIGFAGYTLPVMALEDNLGPARILAKLSRTPLWPGDKRFVEIALKDEGLWPDQVGTAADTDLSLDEHLAKILPPADQYSAVVSSHKLQDTQEGIINGLGVGWSLEDKRCIITQVVHKSPVYAQKVRRGDRILAINEHDVSRFKTSGHLQTYWANARLRPSVDLTVQHRNGQVRVITVALGKVQDDPPVSTIFATSYGPVGYLRFSQFNTDQFREIRQHFSRFRKNNVRDLILDLRYNDGGDAEKAALLASLIAGQAHDGKVFIQAVCSPRYTDRNQTYQLQRQPESLHTRRLVVLTTDSTCSASETIISGLRPYLPVYTVGSSTCGKPYMMQGIAFGDSTLYTVNARVLNSRGIADHTNGIPPDTKAADDLSRELGDPQEKMLHTALQLLAGNRKSKPATQP